MPWVQPKVQPKVQPRVQPWGTATAKAPPAMPRNAGTGRQYSGINVLVLWGAVIEHGSPAQDPRVYPSPSSVTPSAVNAGTSAGSRKNLPASSFAATARS